MKMYFQPQHTWRRSVEVSSDESGSEGEERSARDNTDPSADGRVQQAIGRMPAGPRCGTTRGAGAITTGESDDSGRTGGALAR